MKDNEDHRLIELLEIYLVDRAVISRSALQILFAWVI